MTKHVHFLVFRPFLGELLIEVNNFLSKQHVLMRVFLALRAGHGRFGETDLSGGVVDDQTFLI